MLSVRLFALSFPRTASVLIVTDPLNKPVLLIVNLLNVAIFASNVPSSIKLSALILPLTCSSAWGSVIPMPTRPPVKIAAYRLPVVPVTFTLSPTAVLAGSSSRFVKLTLTPVAIFPLPI